MCVCVHYSGGTCSWQWQDDSGCWQVYDRAAYLQLEKAHKSGATHVELTAAGSKYRVDVKKMEQINIKTKVARNVQRISGGKSLNMLYFI